MVDSNVARIRPADEKSFRLAPQNIEAEQALLGAILVNNEAFYRVSDFLLPEHFYEPVHREIYEIVGKIIRAGKAATPITVKTYLPDQLIADVTHGAVPRAPRRRGDHRHQRRRLRPDDLRPRHPPHADPDRRGDDVDGL